VLLATLVFAMCLRFCRSDKSEESVQAPTIVAAFIQNGEFGLPRKEIEKEYVLKHLNFTYFSIN